MQDNQLHANLSVEEAMHVASSLKLGSDQSKDSKYQVVSHHYLSIVGENVFSMKKLHTLFLDPRNIRNFGTARTPKNDD